MEENKIENIPAFPDSSNIRSGNGSIYPVRQSGMTLRDYFAAQSISSVITENGSIKTVAEMCYKIADEMLKERMKYEK